MKKIILLTLVCLIILANGCSNGNAPNQHVELDEQAHEEKGTVEQPTRKDEISKAIETMIKEASYRKVSIDRISINDDLGNDEDGYYIALVYLTFGVQNSVKTATEVMRMYSDDLVATLANQGIEDISEAAIFWNDAYNNRKLKYSYGYKKNGFYLTGKME